jgi:peptide/nickel transport system permease protein
MTAQTSSPAPQLGALEIESADAVLSSARREPLWRRLLRNPSVLIGGALVLLIALMGIAAPMLSSHDPAAINPSNRNKTPGYESTMRDDEGKKITVVSRFGTDSLGRDVYTRVVYGARVSLIVGIAVAVLSVAVGLAIGLVAGYFRVFDNIVMRVMDGLMAIPAILLAITLVSLSGASLLTLIIAVAVPEIPRVVRLVRAIVLSIREEPYVEAAISVGTPVYKILWRHVLPNTVAPLIVQATFIAGAAILLEAALSFLGVGIQPPDPSLGLMISQSQSFFSTAPHLLFFPGLAIVLTVLGFLLIGDGLRDAFDVRDM